MAEDIVRLLDHLTISRAHIVGYSLGAVVTAKLLTVHPDRFVTATLGGSSGSRTWTGETEAAAEAAARELESGIPSRSVILATAPADEPPPSEEAIRQRSKEFLAVSDALAMPHSTAAVVTSW